MTPGACSEPYRGDGAVGTAMEGILVEAREQGVLLLHVVLESLHAVHKPADACLHCVVILARTVHEVHEAFPAPHRAPDHAHAIFGTLADRRAMPCAIACAIAGTSTNHRRLLALNTASGV